jgi:hypothetical protein
VGENKANTTGQPLSANFDASTSNVQPFLAKSSPAPMLKSLSRTRKRSKSVAQKPKPDCREAQDRASRTADATPRTSTPRFRRAADYGGIFANPDAEKNLEQGNDENLAIEDRISTAAKLRIGLRGRQTSHHN